ncbi:E3 ubiquitin ligase BIG BROTHER-like isoform X1 [Cynara cardunculus var. scolymus]|uniref:E3 ubiquitin ligase BIG BROTHER-like isoform X1 n=1 Tax=Cynara cardunculus var. scolymus TaxID=59895 RepID=UPI000D62F7BE|nr:E3 ubiquitin ligase BIG BROTHER-like isoform X1 [Cynara cardunculus var. scolymus]XP_024977442.1 E3 ubiquitin ligase BIG BROTHER-like isoform X1 [Cynara cardunculus var. scolymus]XP_024977451.1 E3 ubiquitin ligase BIG BROTHER-like isoform X1 [Cynara cardunculus var. scolymus]
MSRDVDVHEHYLNGTLPADIAENLNDFLPEEEGLCYEEVILQQASVYESIQEYGRNRVVASDDHPSRDSSVSSEDEGEASRNESVISQEAMDEALARSLQELGEDFDEFFITQFSGNANSITESPVATPTEQAPSSDLRQDDIDPDNMQYEELVNLTESVGVENRGLSESHISRLPTSIYTSRMFSKNKEEKLCVVCQENFKFGKRLITLPCSHQYHSECIIDWLKIKKICPMCQKEVI